MCIVDMQGRVKSIYALSFMYVHMGVCVGGCMRLA